MVLLLVLLLGGSGNVAAQTICAEDSTLVNNRGAALAADCTTLLGLMNELRGTASLNWATSLDMDSWDGITVAGTTARVTELDLGGDLAGDELGGEIPAGLGDLANLEQLYLQNNALTGAIPTTVNQLSSLTRFYASGNTNLCLPAGSTTWHTGLTYNDLLLLCKTITA